MSPFHVTLRLKGETFQKRTIKNIIITQKSKTMNFNVVITCVSICVILPIIVTWLGTRTKIKTAQLRAQIIMEAIKNNPGIDPDKLAEAINPKKPNEEKERLYRRLQRGSILGLLGIAGIAGAVVIAWAGFFTTEDLMVMIFLSVVVLAIGVGNLITFLYQRKQISTEETTEIEEA